MIETTALPSVQEGVSLYNVTYQSEGLNVKAMLAVPDQQQEQGPLPALLYCRGGYRGVGKVRAERISQMAAFGYVVLAPHYRGNEGGDGQDEFGGRELADVHAAYELLVQMPNVDRKRISLYGFSRGGMMALLAAASSTNYQAVVVWSGVTDLLLTYEERTDLRRMLKRIVGHPEKQPEAYQNRSPWRRANEINCPVLIIHGMKDENVGMEHAVRLADALAMWGKPHELWLAEEASHLFAQEEIERYTRRMFSWLNQLNKEKASEHALHPG